MTGDGLSRGLSDMWRSVVLFLPSALAFLAIVFVGYLLARLARTLTTKALRRTGFDRAVQQGPAGRLIRPGTPSATDVCARLAFFVVLLFALQLAFGIWGSNPASELINALISWLPQVFVAIVIIVVTTAIARAAHDLTLAVLGNLAYARVLARAVTAVIVTLGVIAGLDQIGIATSVTRPLLITILATVAGVIIVGVGGGLIRPMQQRWEGWLDRAATESAAIRSQARAYAEERARQAARPTGDTAHPGPAGPASSPGAESSPGSAGPTGNAGPAGSAGYAARSGHDGPVDRDGAAPAGHGGPGPAGHGGAGPAGYGEAVSAGHESAGSAGHGGARSAGPGGAEVAGHGAAPFGAPAGHGGLAAHGTESAGPVGRGAVAAESGSDRPVGHPEVDSAASHAGADPVRGTRRSDGITSRDARPAGADDVAAGARRASGADLPQHAQAVAAGAAVAGIQGQEGAGAPGETPDREGSTFDRPSTADDGVTAEAPTVATAASASGLAGRAGSDSVGSAERTGSDPVGLAAGDGSERMGLGVGAGSDSVGLAARDDSGPVPATSDATVVLPPADPGDSSGSLSSGGGDARTADFGAVGPETYPEEDDDWAWEARWAEEERQARERGGDETQIVGSPASGMVDDRPHLIPGFDRHDDRPPMDDEDPTIFVHIGTAETTLLTPGVRPASPSAEPAAEDDDPTVPGHRLNAAAVPDDVAVPDDAEPTRLLGAIDEPDKGSGASAVVRYPDEPTTSVIATGDAGEPTTSFVAGSPRPAGSSASLADDDPASGEPTTWFVSGGSASGEPTTSFVSDGSASGEPTTSFVSGSSVSGEPTVSLAADGPDVGEPTTAFVVHGSDPDDPPTTFITRGTDSDDEVTVVRIPQAGVGEGGESPEAGRSAAGLGGEDSTTETAPNKGNSGK
jgi:hypothetical protein